MISNNRENQITLISEMTVNTDSSFLNCLESKTPISERNNISRDLMKKTT